jgi:hypothetical protein
MYSNVHGSIGIVAVVSSDILARNFFTDNIFIRLAIITLGVIVAFLLHDPTDILGEKGYGGLKKTLWYEVPPFLLMLALAGATAFYAEQWWYYLSLYIIGWTAGNGMDLWDKKGYFSIYDPRRYPATHFFYCHRRDAGQQIPFTLQQTKNATYISSIAVIILTILLCRHL